MTKKTAFHQVAFDKVTSVAMGPDAARFLAAVPILKLIDSDLDKVSAENWARGKAHLGDKPCELLEQILTPEHRQAIDNYVQRYKVDPKDMWQSCNLLTLQLTKIRDLTAEVRAAKATGERNLEPRRALVAEHEKLSVLAATFAAINPADLAKTLRQSIAQHGDTDLEAARAAINPPERSFKLGPVKTNCAEFGGMLQALDDANDMVVDLQSEFDQNRISPNRFILKMKEIGMDARIFLAELKFNNPKAFESHKGLRGKDINPKVRKMVLDDIAKHQTAVDKVKMQYAMRGESVKADYFPTHDVDLDPNAKKASLYATMPWGLRVSAAASAALKR